jgi:hypothetical protein
MKKILLWMVRGFILINFNCFAGNENHASQSYVCRQSYALCTTAPCKPVPGSKDQSICSCVVENGPSLGQLSCARRKPILNNKGQHLLTSNFSFINAETNKIMTCTGNHAWTDCLDKPCIIDSQNSNQAICICDIKYSKNFITFGGQCQTDSCNTTLYSGATTDMLNQGTQALIEYLHLEKSPMQNCPASKT